MIIHFQSGYCHSVGHEHDYTADGLHYNLYDAGEFIFFRHPESKVEVHTLQRMVTSSMAANAAIAVRVCEKPLKDAPNRGKCDTITIEAKNCHNGRDTVTITEDGKCVEGNKAGIDYTTKNTKVRYYKNHHGYHYIQIMLLTLLFPKCIQLTLLKYQFVQSY